MLAHQLVATTVPQRPLVSGDAHASDACRLPASRFESGSRHCIEAAPTCLRQAYHSPMGLRLATGFVVAICLSIGPAASHAAATRALRSGKYQVVVHNGEFVFKGTFALKVTGNTIKGSSHWTCCPGPRTDPLHGSVAGSKVTIHRDCSSQGQTACVSQAFVGTIVASHGSITVSGTWSGDGAAKSNNTWTMTGGRRQHTLSGAVVYHCPQCGGDPRPAGGLTVRATPQGGGKAQSARTSADGTYSMPLPNDTFTVALKGTRGAPSAREVRMNKDRSGIDFEACPPVSLRAFASCQFEVAIRLVDVAGQPVQGAGIVAEKTDTGIFGLGTGEAFARTDSGGRARLMLTEGQWTVFTVGDLSHVRVPGMSTGLEMDVAQLFSEDSFVTRFDRCEGGATGPVPGTTRAGASDPRFQGCQLDFEVGRGQGAAPTHVDMTAGLYLLHVAQTHATLDWDVEVYDSQAEMGPVAPGQPPFLNILVSARVPRSQRSATLLVATTAVVGTPSSVQVVVDEKKTPRQGEPRLIRSRARSCSPGHINANRTSCRIDLGPAEPRGRASFSFPAR